MFYSELEELNLFIENTSLIEEAVKDTFNISTDIYPQIEKVLSTPEGNKKFLRLVEIFINKNSSRLTTVGPQYMILFTEQDKEGFFKLFNQDPNDIKKCIKKTTEEINAQAQWKLLTNNPIFTIFYCVIRYYTIKKDTKGLNTALIILALAMYPSMFSKYFPYEPNVGVMQFTIDNLSNKFIIKKCNTIFATLTQSIQNSWKFHQKDFISGKDYEVIRFIQRIRNDQNSLMKKISINYHENHKKGLSVSTTVDKFDDNSVVDVENNSNRVSSLTEKIVLAMVLNGVDLKFAEFAASASNVSKSELRNYLSMIIVEKNTDELKSFIESILFLYLYDEKNKLEEINSKKFILFCLSVFKKTNSSNPNITNIKKTLDKWGESVGIYGKFSRLATRVDYTRAIFTYMIMSIQKYS